MYKAMNKPELSSLYIFEPGEGLHEKNGNMTSTGDTSCRQRLTTELAGYARS